MSGLKIAHGCAIQDNADGTFKVLGPGEEIQPWIPTQIVNPGQRVIRKKGETICIITAEVDAQPTIEEVNGVYMEKLQQMLGGLQVGDFIEGPNGYPLAVRTLNLDTHKVILHDVAGKYKGEFEFNTESFLVTFGTSLPTVHHKDDTSWTTKMKEVLSA